jgi:luciferase family oxidoreductase group 1
MKWSVLDQSPAKQGQTEDSAIRATLALAKLCDQLGFYRYWLSEHHNSGALAGTAPEILVAAIAATTPRIRVGSAGVMLPHYSALKVAEQFRVLEAIAPGRIDLGVGRAPGSDQLTAMALNPHANAHDEFPRQVHELQHWITDSALPEDHPFRRVIAHPRGPSSPEIWILGSSDYGAQLAAHFGLPYAFAYFFSDGKGVEQALALYRRNYRPSTRYPQPIATICVWALAAETEAEALRLMASRELWRVNLDKGGVRDPLASPEQAAAYPYTDADRVVIQKIRNKAFAGTADQVAGKLQALAAELQLDEIVINTWTYDELARERSYRLLAAALGLIAQGLHRS